MFLALLIIVGVRVSRRLSDWGIRVGTTQCLVSRRAYRLCATDVASENHHLPLAPSNKWRGGLNTARYLNLRLVMYIDCHH